MEIYPHPQFIPGWKPTVKNKEDVYASSGIKLVPKGIRVQEKMLAIIMERNKTDPIIGGIYIEC